MLNLPAILRTVSDLITRARYQEAERILGYCTQKIPKDSLVRYLAFKLAAASGVGRRARLDALLGLRQKDEFTLYRQFSALMIMECYAEAFDKAEELISIWKRVSAGEMLNPTGDDLRLILGKRQAAAWFSRALRKLEKSPSTLKKTPWYFFYKALFLDRGNKEEALALLGRLAAVDIRRYGWMKYYSGRLQLYSGRTAEAVGSFGIALRSRPGDWIILCLQAECFACLKNYRGAYRNFKTAIELNPRAAAGIKVWKGEILLWQGRYGEALRTINEVSASCPPFAFSWRGIANYKLGNTAAALKDLAKALDYNSLDYEALSYRAEIARLEKDYDLAEGLIKSVLREKPAYFWAHANLALVNFKRGRPGACLDNFNQALFRVAPLMPGGFRKEYSADNAVKMLDKWFLLSKGNRGDELYCLAGWFARG